MQKNDEDALHTSMIYHENQGSKEHNENIQ